MTSSRRMKTARGGVGKFVALEFFVNYCSFESIWLIYFCSAD